MTTPAAPADIARDVIADAVEQARAYGLARVDLAPVVDRYVRAHRAVWDYVPRHDPHQPDDVDAWGVTPSQAPRPRIMTDGQVANLAAAMTGGHLIGRRYLVLPDEVAPENVPADPS
ncbi:hypothetical protein AB0E12_17255 [Micromonospora chersina]|uniref:hypothetical protein n=1 Tax=Micromonospora chersina TaxID=47854 RepID=UPI0033F1092D